MCGNEDFSGHLFSYINMYEQLGERYKGVRKMLVSRGTQANEEKEGVS